MTIVNWVGDFGVIVTTCEDATADAVAFTRQQLMDWHNIDPVVCGFIPETVQECPCGGDCAMVRTDCCGIAPACVTVSRTTDDGTFTVCASDAGCAR